MPKVTFSEAGRAPRTVEAAVGITLMEAARQNGVAGIIAQCGGACACATCHVYVAPAWASKLVPPEDMELGMLEAAWEPRSTSRLSCQIHMTAGLDGLSVTVPQQQNTGTA